MTAGQAVGRHRDLPVIAGVENTGGQRRALAPPRMAKLHLGELDVLRTRPNFRGISFDMTALGPAWWTKHSSNAARGCGTARRPSPSHIPEQAAPTPKASAMG